MALSFEVVLAILAFWEQMHLPAEIINIWCIALKQLFVVLKFMKFSIIHIRMGEICVAPTDAQSWVYNGLPHTRTYDETADPMQFRIMDQKPSLMLIENAQGKWDNVSCRHSCISRLLDKCDDSIPY